MMRTYKLPRAGLVDLQMKRLRRTLELAHGNVPFWHDALDRAAMRPHEFRKMEDLRKLPILSKSEAIENSASILSRRAPAKYLLAGSGTTGSTLIAAEDSPARDTNWALFLRQLVKFGMLPWDRLVTVWNPERYWRRGVAGKKKGKPITPLFEMGRWASLWRLSTRISPLQTTEGDPAADLRNLLALKPDLVMDRASHLLRMSEQITPSAAPSGIKAINCVSEAFTDVAARSIEGAFGTKVLHSLGSTDVGTVGGECTFQRGMHLYEDWVIYEVLRDGEPVGPSEVGELVATVLRNDAMPLVRYATGDIVELADGERCECGSSFTRVRKMLGRQEDWLQTADGSLLPPFDVAEEVEARLGMREYQIVQRGIGDFLVKTRDPDGDERALSEPLGTLLSELVGAEVALSFVEQPPEDLWLKSRPVTSQVK